jgi:hypothetical protein
MKRRNFLKLFGICLLSFTAIACKPQPPSANNVQGGNIVMVTLEDGTRCAVFDGYKAGGLSCDWKNTE